MNPVLKLRSNEAVNINSWFENFRAISCEGISDERISDNFSKINKINENLASCGQSKGAHKSLCHVF